MLGTPVKYNTCTLRHLSDLKMDSPGVAYRRLGFRRERFGAEFVVCLSIRFFDLLSLSRIDFFSLCDPCGWTVSKWNPQIEVASFLIVTWMNAFQDASLVWHKLPMPTVLCVGSIWRCHKSNKTVPGHRLLTTKRHDSSRRTKGEVIVTLLR
jgi:hypothetical protein